MPRGAPHGPSPNCATFRASLLNRSLRAMQATMSPGPPLLEAVASLCFSLGDSGPERPARRTLPLGRAVPGIVWADLYGPTAPGHFTILFARTIFPLCCERTLRSARVRRRHATHPPSDKIRLLCLASSGQPIMMRPPSRPAAARPGPHGEFFRGAIRSSPYVIATAQGECAADD